MPQTARMSLVGYERIKNRVNRVSDAVADKSTRNALKKAASLVRADAKRRAEQIDDPHTARKISKNIRMRFATRIFKKTGDKMYRVGVSTLKGRIPKGNPDTGVGGNTPHWHLVEYGTEHARAQPFMRPALENNINKVIDVFGSEMDNQLNKVSK